MHAWVLSACMRGMGSACYMHVMRMVQIYLCRQPCALVTDNMTSSSLPLTANA